jgi:hypothetical protein
MGDAPPVADRLDTPHMDRRDIAAAVDDDGVHRGF